MVCAWITKRKIPRHCFPSVHTLMEQHLFGSRICARKSAWLVTSNREFILNRCISQYLLRPAFSSDFSQTLLSLLWLHLHPSFRLFARPSVHLSECMSVCSQFFFQLLLHVFLPRKLAVIVRKWKPEIFVFYICVFLIFFLYIRVKGRKMVLE